MNVEIEKSKGLAQGFIDLHERVAAFSSDIANWMKQGERIGNEALGLAEDIQTTKEGIQRFVLQHISKTSDVQEPG